MEVDRDAILESLGPARRFADPDAPTEARLMAARGALPLPPPQIVTVLYALSFDPDAEVKGRALKSLIELPDRVLDPALGEALHPGLLAFLAEQHREDGDRAEKIALNPATADETICFLARLPFPNVIDIIANNQTRLLRCPAILDALGDNALTGHATIDRLLDFLGIRRHEEDAEPEAEAAEPEEPLPTLEEVTSLRDLEDPSDLPPELLEEPGHAEGEEGRSKSVFALIQGMNVIQKIKLARFGSGEARAILIRDRNRIVSTAAIRSPKVSDADVLSYAKARNLSEEVLRIISSNRDWTKTYAVQLALVTNPKTPVPSAIKFLNYLSDRDLRTIMRSREVPAAISTQARRVLLRKGKA